MVIFVVAHTIFNIIIGFLSSGTSFLASFKITSICLKRYHPVTRHYESITINNKIIIDEQNNLGESIVLENTFKLKKKKVNFNKVVHFKSIPNKDESPKSEIWYNNNDYISFKNDEIRRRQEKYNLQKNVAQVEEDKHINNLLEAMQEKERQQELDRIEKEKFLG